MQINLNDPIFDPPIEPLIDSSNEYFNERSFDHPIDTLFEWFSMGGKKRLNGRDRCWI